MLSGMGIDYSSLYPSGWGEGFHLATYGLFPTAKRKTETALTLLTKS